jgi:hypothetical protein
MKERNRSASLAVGGIGTRDTLQSIFSECRFEIADSGDCTGSLESITAKSGSGFQAGAARTILRLG